MIENKTGIFKVSNIRFFGNRSVEVQNNKSDYECVF